MQAITSYPIRSRVEQIRDFLGGREGREKVAEEGGVVAARGFKEKFARGGALIVAYISQVGG